MAGLYFEPDIFAQKTGKTHLFRYKQIFQHFPQGRNHHPYFPIFVSIQAEDIHFCLDELYVGYQVDLFHLPISDLPSDQQRLASILGELFDSNQDIQIDLHDHHMQQGDHEVSGKSRLGFHPKNSENQPFHFSDLPIWNTDKRLDHRYDNKENPKKFTINRLTLLLDFLYDLRYGEVFRDCPSYKQLQVASEKTFPLNGIYFKAQYYYLIAEGVTRTDWRCQEVLNRARNIISTQRSYQSYLELSHSWFSPSDPDEANYGEIFEDIFLESNRMFFSKKILFLAANPSDDPFLQLGKEHKNLDVVIRLSTHRNRFQLIPRLTATLDDMRHALIDHRPQVLHFAGHGGKTDMGEVEKEWENTLRNLISRDKVEEYQVNWGGASILIFQDHEDKRKGIETNPESFLSLLKSFESLECVYFNACSSEALVEKLAEEIPFAIGNQGPIQDKLAIALSESFYRNLGSGNSYVQAFRNCINGNTLKQGGWSSEDVQNQFCMYKRVPGEKRSKKVSLVKN